MFVGRSKEERNGSSGGCCVGLLSCFVGALLKLLGNLRTRALIFQFYAPKSKPKGIKNIKKEKEVSSSFNTPKRKKHGEEKVNITQPADAHCLRVRAWTPVHLTCRIVSVSIYITLAPDQAHEHVRSETRDPRPHTAGRTCLDPRLAAFTPGAGFDLGIGAARLFRGYFFLCFRCFSFFFLFVGGDFAFLVCG